MSRNQLIQKKKKKKKKKSSRSKRNFRLSSLIQHSSYGTSQSEFYSCITDWLIDNRWIDYSVSVYGDRQS